VKSQESGSLESWSPLTEDSETPELPKPYFDLPIITGLQAEEIYPGNRLQDPQATRVIETLAILRNLKTNLWEELSEINIDAQGNLTLYPMNALSQIIYLGRKNLEQRVWRLCQVLDYLETHDIESQYIDCRFDAQGVITRPENLTLAKWNSLPQDNRKPTFPLLPEES